MSISIRQILRYLQAVLADSISRMRYESMLGFMDSCRMRGLEWQVPAFKPRIHRYSLAQDVHPAPPVAVGYQRSLAPHGGRNVKGSRVKNDKAMRCFSRFIEDNSISNGLLIVSFHYADETIIIWN